LSAIEISKKQRIGGMMEAAAAGMGVREGFRLGERDDDEDEDEDDE
jgi:hypothetical protein